MVPKKFPSFPAKLLLFGEYVVLHGGDTLSLPMHQYGLQKTYIQKANKPFFKKLYHHIIGIVEFQDRVSAQFLIDIEDGLHYDSTIPIGYGLGSSGALVAAIYSDYILSPQSDPKILRQELALIENFFHSKSSGIDPLTVFINQPIYISNEDLHIVGLPICFDQFYLYDSQLKRNASEAIHLFRTLENSASFCNNVHQLAEWNNQMIYSFVHHEDITTQMFRFSHHQLKVMSSFVPDHVKKSWKLGLKNDTYAMKLCGAGMGGMFIVYSLEKNENWISIL